VALLHVTKDTPSTNFVNVNRDMDVVFDCTTVTFSVYVRVIRSGAIAFETKVRFGSSVTVSLLKDDVVEARPVGTGDIQVTIL
jgi:hypothetical protein